MIYVAFMKISSDRISSQNHRKRTEAESNAARRLLGSLYRHVFGEAMPEIIKNEIGKPFFKAGQSRQLSISHTDGGVAVALSDERLPIGVDIEIEIPQQKAERICKRFPFVKERSLTRLDGLCVFIGLDFGESVKLHNADNFEEACGCDFTAQWTVTEALLKADGGGFASKEKLDSLQNASRSTTFKIDNAYLSIVETSANCK